MSTVKAVIYCRVSSRGQEHEGHGLESQETRCRQHAEAKGYEVTAVFPDTYTGAGSYMQRPGMAALLSFIDAQPNEQFVVIFDDLKRASRDTRAFLDLRDAFRLRGVRAECLNFRLEDTPEGEFLETIFAAQGALERKQNGRQVSQKMRARMEAGYWIHNAPIGYRYETIKGRGKVLVPDEPAAVIIQEAFEGYATGRFETQAEVKRFLDGFPDLLNKRKGKLTQQRVTDILTQPVYTGHICSEVYDLNWLKAQHEPLVSLDVFDKVQERRNGTAKAPKRKNIGDAFALRGIAVCAGCNVPLRSSITKGNGGSYHYYLCQSKNCDHYGKSIKRDKIEGDVGDLIKSLQPSEGLMGAARAMFGHIWEAKEAQTKDVLSAGKRKITNLDKDIDRLLDTITSVSKQSVIARCEDKIDMLEREKTKLAQEMAEMAQPKGSFEEKLEPVLTFIANPFKIWASGNIELRRLVLKLAFADRIQYDRFEGARTPEIAFPFKALGGIADPKVCFGAQERTRTSTSIRTLAPEASASTNSATWAGVVKPAFILAP